MFKKLLCGAALLSVATFSNAAVITQTASVGIQDTNYDEVITINQFDSALGTLNSVMFTLAGSVEGEIRVENTSLNSATDIEAVLSATLTLTDTVLNNTLVITLPAFSQTITGLTTFDGDIDFGGTSGATFGDLSDTDTQSATFSDASTLSTFTGMGTIDLNLNALATSVADGGGNLVTQFITQAGGDITVVYDYDVPSVSAPSHLALLGLGLVAFAGMRRKA